MVNNKNTSGFASHVIVAIAVAVLIIASLGYVLYKNYFAGNGEIEITDSSVISKLDDNVTYLSAWSSGNGFNLSGLYEDDINVANLSESDKLELSLMSLYNNGEFTSIPSNQDISINDDSYLDGIISDGKMIEHSAVADRFTKLFGGDLAINADFSALNGDESCPGFLYDLNSGAYYSYSMCGGAGTGYYSYNYEYSAKGDNAYVYTSVGYFADNVVYKGLDSDEVAGQTDSFDGIGESNYSDFSKFKWTFAKNSDGDYSFVSVVRVDE